MSYGKRIFVDGKRPEWFRNKDAEKMIAITKWAEEQKPTDHNRNHNVDSWDWNALEYIQLPADHEVYIALNAGLKPWRPEINSEAVPEDYAGGNVIRRNGSVVHDVLNHAYSRVAGWGNDATMMADLDIVGYEPKVTTVTDIENIHTKIAKQFFDELPKNPEQNPVMLSLEQVTDLFNIMLSHFIMADEVYPNYKPSEKAGPISFSLQNTLNSLKEAGLIPEPVDPDLVKARELVADVAGQGGNSRQAYINGERDDTFAVQTALAALKSK